MVSLYQLCLKRIHNTTGMYIPGDIGSLSSLTCTAITTSKLHLSNTK